MGLPLDRSSGGSHPHPRPMHSMGVLKRGKKKVFLNGSFAKRPRVAHMFNHGWW